jgi:prolipoprotein diacylglyceryltransferase
MRGRVWAGGKSPFGHVVGGIIDPVIYHNNRLQLKIVNSIADAITGLL